MPFKPGQSGNPNGKPRGAKSQRTKEWEQLGEYLTNAGATRVKQILSEAKPEQFMRYYNLLLEHFKPKLQRTELTGDPEKPLTWNEVKQYPATNGTHTKTNGSARLSR